MKKNKTKMLHARPDFPEDVLKEVERMRGLMKAKSDIAVDVFIEQNTGRKETKNNEALKALMEYEDYFRNFACEVFMKALLYAGTGKVTATDVEVDEMFKR